MAWIAGAIVFYGLLHFFGLTFLSVSIDGVKKEMEAWRKMLEARRR